VSGTGGNNIYEITPDGTQSIFASGVYNSYGLAFEPVPEPAAPVLLTLGAAILFFLARRRCHRAVQNQPEVSDSKPATLR
jgi:hypothetical protein